VTGAHQPPRDVAAHPSKTRDSDLHAGSSSMTTRPLRGGVAGQPTVSKLCSPRRCSKLDRSRLRACDPPAAATSGA
jgi:hypothetical protein